MQAPDLPHLPDRPVHCPAPLGLMKGQKHLWVYCLYCYTAHQFHLGTSKHHTRAPCSHTPIVAACGLFSVWASSCDQQCQFGLCHLCQLTVALMHPVPSSLQYPAALAALTMTWTSVAVLRMSSCMGGSGGESQTCKPAVKLAHCRCSVACAQLVV